MSQSSPTELMALRDLMAQLCSPLALALAEQINIEPILEVEQVEDVPIGDLLGRSENVLATVFSLSGSNTSESILSLPEEAARICVSLLEGNDGLTPPELLTDAQTDKLVEMMAAFTRGFANALSNQSGASIEVETCSSQMGAITLPPIFALEENGVQARITLIIPSVYEGTMAFYFTPALAQTLVADRLPEAAKAAAPSDHGEILSEDELARMLSDIGGLGGESVSAPTAMSASSMGASPFAPLPSFESSLPRGMELIMDIPLDVTVELGRVRMLIKDVLELASGSIVELDRVAGEPVDLLVNGRLIAKGEVVVIEDNFGIRITEILSPADRVASLGRGR